MKKYLFAATLSLNITVWADTGNRHTETFLRNQERAEQTRQERLRQSSSSPQEERLLQECRREAARPQPTATTPKGGACDQLVELRMRRGYTEQRWHGGFNAWCLFDAQDNVLQCGAPVK